MFCRGPPGGSNTISGVFRLEASYAAALSFLPSSSTYKYTAAWIYRRLSMALRTRFALSSVKVGHRYTELSIFDVQLCITSFFDTRGS